MPAPLVRPVVGNVAPTIELDDLEGNRWRLSDRLGGPARPGSTVVVIFHRHIH